MIEFFDPKTPIRGKKFVVDSSSLITISDNCFIKVMKYLSEKEGITFILPESVYMESVETPLRIRRYELNAIRIRDAIEDGYLKVAKTTPEIKERMRHISMVAENICSSENRPIRLIHLGETETLALIAEINAHALVIDERTTRMLIEEPQNLVGFVEYRQGAKVDVNRSAMNAFAAMFKGLKIFRSIELIALSYDDGSFENEIHRSRQALEALMFAAKYSGCAVSFDEINDYLKGVD